MYGVWILMGLNAALWGLPLVATPKAHMTPIGSYPLWWFDDLPWAALLISVGFPSLALAIGGMRHAGVRRGVKAAASVSLCAFLPYACMAGAGI